MEESKLSGAAAGSRLLRRRRALVIGALTAAAVSVGGLYGASFIESPAQASADARPPKASVLTALVKRQVLKSTVVLRGTFSDGRTIKAEPSSVAATDAAPPPGQLLVTGVYAHPGERVGTAKALIEYSGRPVYALRGTVPAYRDLGYGADGKDVARLQAALQAEGFATSPDASGHFGAGTERAVRKLYAKLGYPVPVTAAADPAAGRSAADDAKDGPPAGGTTAPDADGGAAPLGAPAAAQPVLHAMVPASEVVYVPSRTVRVVQVPAQVGDPVKGPVVVLARGEMTLTGQLDPEQAGMVTAGLTAQVVSEATGAHADAVVESVGQPVTPGASAQDGGGDDAAGAQPGMTYIPLVIKPKDAWAAAFAGQDVRITITAAATPGPVLTVPQAAITSGADTMTTVTVLDAAGRRRTVRVSPGVAADGNVEVSAAAGALAEGDRVVVG